MDRYKGVIWKDAWLGHSETFIRDQIETMQDWDFLRLGYHVTEDPLVEPDYAPYGSDRISRNLRRAFGTSLYGSEYARRIDEIEASVVHAHFLSGGANVAKLANKLGIPLVTTLHNPRVAPHQTGLPKTFHGTYARRVRRLVEVGSKFVAVSNYVASAVVEAGLPPSKVEVVHIGTAIVPQIQTSERNGIVFVGRLIEMKGADDLLQAIKRLPDSLRGVAVTIVGEGPQRAILEKYARDHQLNVSFTGWVRSEHLPQLLAKHEIFCGPSKTDPLGVQEGFGLVFLEAALQGLPCVGYRSGGVVDAVAEDESGILVPEGDVRGLSRAISTLLEDPQARVEMGRRGRQRVEGDFDIEVQAKKLHEILRTSSER